MNECPLFIAEIAGTLEWLEHLGPLAGTVAVVVLFLRYLQTDRVNRSEIERERIATLKEIDAEARSQISKITDSFAVALANTSRVVEENTRQLGRIESVLNRFMEDSGHVSRTDRG